MSTVLISDWSFAIDSTWLWHRIAFIALWTGMLYTVQAETLVVAQDISPRYARWAARIRLLIDICFTTAISIVLPPAGLVTVSILVFFAHSGLIAYFQYFHRPMSALSLYHSWREGAKASRHRFSTHAKGLILVFGSLLLVRVSLVLTEPEPDISRSTLWMIGAIATVGYVGLMILASWIDPLDKILTTRGIGRLGLIRGYFVAWLAEFYYLGQPEVLESAVRQRQITSDALTPLETSIPIQKRLVIVQAESLDFNILGHVVGNLEVTPYLNRLREKSLFYRITVPRYIGSADADFVMLNGAMPSTHIITYNIPNYPYHDTLPQFLAQYGYRTSVFHGNTGNFYNRRAAFEKMGFAKIHFEEEMVERGLPRIGWGVEDRQVFNYSGQLLRESPGRTCHYIITLTTHTPYTLLTAADREIVQNPQCMAHHYFNNMRYLDNQLRDYIGTLDSATVLIFSDHPADPAIAPGFMPDCRERREFVPCLIYDAESDLGALQRTRDQDIAGNGTLSLLDISSFLRAQVAAANGQPDLKFPKAAIGG